MKTEAIVALVSSLAMATAGGVWGTIGWILFIGALAVIYIQRTVVKDLRGELTKEKNARELVSNKVDEQKIRIDKQQQEIMRFTELEVEFERQLEQLAKEKLELIARIEELEKERITNRNHLVELAKSNEFLRTTLDEVLKRVKTLEDK